MNKYVLSTVLTIDLETMMTDDQKYGAMLALGATNEQELVSSIGENILNSIKAKYPNVSVSYAEITEDNSGEQGYEQQEEGGEPEQVVSNDEQVEGAEEDFSYNDDETVSQELDEIIEENNELDIGELFNQLDESEFDVVHKITSSLDDFNERDDIDSVDAILVDSEAIANYLNYIVDEDIDIVIDSEHLQLDDADFRIIYTNDVAEQEVL